MSNLHYSLLLGASACVQLSQLEEAITWCKKSNLGNWSLEAKEPTAPTVIDACGLCLGDNIATDS